MLSALRASAIRERELVCSQASYITSCAFSVGSSLPRPPMAVRKRSITRRSGRVGVAAPDLGGALPVFLARGSFETGICGSSTSRRHGAPDLCEGCPVLGDDA